MKETIPQQIQKLDLDLRDLDLLWGDSDPNQLGWVADRIKAKIQEQDYLIALLTKEAG